MTSPERPYAVIDLDGVLADVRHRLHHLSGRPKDWEAFFAGIPDDPPLSAGVELVRLLAMDHEVVYVTGRPERTRAVTEAWLARHGLPGGRLVMRRDGDRRPARVAKPELVRSLARRRPVALVVDDDEAVCAAFAAAGWPVQHADWMHADTDDSVVLRQAQERLGRT